jgi:acyl dehydratase
VRATGSRSPGADQPLRGCRRGHQWIHIDVQRANRGSPLGGPIAHGYLTLALFVPLWSQILVVTDARMTVNYGLNRVRFPAPVPVGSKLRLAATVKDVEPITGGIQLTVAGVIERQGGAARVRS